MAAILWYGPLIDLSAAPSHIGDYVQLLVFVHRSNPVQYKLSKGGSRTVIRTDIHVGDDTRPFFSVSLWDKKMGSSVSAGDIILLQNVRVTRFVDAIEARTVQYSSILSLVHPYESLFYKGVDDLVESCRVGVTVRGKLRKVIEWVHQSRPSLDNELQSCQLKRKVLGNWKMHEEQKSRKCHTLLEVLHLATSCKAVFHASVGEIFLSSVSRDFEKERMFIRRRLINRNDTIVEDMICTGCQLCGSPLGIESVSERKNGPLYCEKSSNRIHLVGSIYRPFMLYVWDDSEYIPLLVRDRAAKFLFADIKADKVMQSFKGQRHHRNLNSHHDVNSDAQHCEMADEEALKSCSSVADGRLKIKGKDLPYRSPNFYLIWLILLRLLVQHRNSPLKFEVLVSPSLEMEDGKFEMISVSMPCFSIPESKS
ncbi:hypothetical protein Ancab_038272 [Ancistrocladus abbreviatus]